MPHSCPSTGAAAPCVEHCASNRLPAGQLTWCQVTDSSARERTPHKSMSRRMRHVAAALALVVACLATACGGTTGNGAGGIGESGASLVSSEAFVYASADGDLGSSRWQQVDTLLKKFPVR